MAKVDLLADRIQVEAGQEQRTINQFCKYHQYQNQVPDPAYQATVPDPSWQATIPDPANPGGPNIPNPVARTNVPNPTPRAMVNNPENKKQFLKRKLMEFIRESVQAFEANDEADKARKLAADKATAEVVLT